MISVITPTLNEADNLPRRAAELRAQPGDWEWIVADGESTDQTTTVAEALGARVVPSARGRGTQLNVGARASRGDILLFLHADTHLPPGAFSAIRRAILHEKYAGGNFAVRFEGNRLFCELLAATAFIGQKVGGIYFGDTAIFARRDVFEQIGGFPDQPLFEDYEFSRRLEAAGRTRRLGLHVVASGRRFQGCEIRTYLTWGAMHLLYHAGVSPRTLAALYARGRRAGA